LQDDYIPPVRIEKIPPKENWFEWSTANGPRSTADCNFWLKLMNYQNWLLTVNRWPLTINF
jgi:hypothetical protein